MAKTRIQVSIDSEVSAEANKVIDELGLTPATVLTALYKRIIATGELPFYLQLTRREKANLGLIMETQDMKPKQVETESDMQEWLGEEGAK